LFILTAIYQLTFKSSENSLTLSKIQNMSTAQIIETIRQLPIVEQQHIAHTILKNTAEVVGEKSYNHSFATDEEGYAAMAADTEREEAALEWVEGTLNHEEL